MTLSPELLTSNLLSPVVLAFVLGIVARVLRSDLSIPPAIQSYLSIFLLMAIGLKGGVALRATSFGDVALLLLVTVVAGLVTCASAYALARIWLRDNRIEAGAIAAHFGSVSAVTFIAAQQFAERSGATPEGIKACSGTTCAKCWWGKPPCCSSAACQLARLQARKELPRSTKGTAGCFRAC